MNFYDDIDCYSENIAVITEKNEKINYNELLKRADDLIGYIQKRCLVFAICDNCVESLIGYLGFLRGKIVPVMINNGISIELIDTLLDLYRPEYIWLPKENSKKFEKFIVCYSDGDYVLLKTNFLVDYELNDDLAILLTTSGSTGSPKFVRQSYKNITSNANSIAEYLHITSSDKPISTLPMSYTYGLSIINSHLLKGASIILTNRNLMDKVFWEQLKQNNATTFGGVPFIYEILKKLRFNRMELPSLKILTQAGGKLGEELSKEFADICTQKGIKFYVMYGQTEATARMSYLPYEYSIKKAGSMGIAIPGGEFWLEDDSGEVISCANVTGELIYRGDNVSLGYAENRHDLAKGDENKGILKTGDMAQRDDEGFYYIVGRKKRFLKLFGSRVNLDELEQMLKNRGFECACSGEDDKLKVYITNNNDMEKVTNCILENTDINKHGFHVIYINEIPRSDSGKVLYSLLKS